MRVASLRLTGALHTTFDAGQGWVEHIISGGGQREYEAKIEGDEIAIYRGVRS